MKEEIISSAYVKNGRGDREIGRDRAGGWKYVLVASISAAVLFAGAGLLASALAYSGLIENAKIISRAGTILIVVSAPLFILAAHCLDEIKFEEKRSEESQMPGQGHDPTVSARRPFL